MQVNGSGINNAGSNITAVRAKSVVMTRRQLLSSDGTQTKSCSKRFNAAVKPDNGYQEISPGRRKDKLLTFISSG